LIFWRELEREFCPDPSLSDRGAAWSKNTPPPLAIASSAGFAHRHYVDPVLLGADGEVYDHSPVVPNGDFDSFRLWRSADPAVAELAPSALLFRGDRDDCLPAAQRHGTRSLH